MLPALNRLAPRTLRTTSTGTAVEDALELPDLVAVILAAIDDDDYEAVCKTAGSWCRAFEASGTSCRGAHDTWRTLAARVFPGARTLDKENAQANFYALCQRANEYRNGSIYLKGSGDEDVRAFVMAAVKHNGFALDYADKSLQEDPEIVLVAVRQNGNALTYADKSLQEDPDIVMAAVRQYGQALKYADVSLRDNHEIVLAAVSQSGYALIWASASLKKNPTIVLAAVTQNGQTLQFADRSLKSNPEMVLAAATAVEVAHARGVAAWLEIAAAI